jgi:hypothetical protein
MWYSEEAGRLPFIRPKEHVRSSKGSRTPPCHEVTCHHPFGGGTFWA